MPHEPDITGTGWHRAKIRAEIEMQGKSLKALAEANNLHPKACQLALAQRNKPGEIAIATFLRVPLWEIWPDRWEKPSSPNDQPTRIDGRRRA